MKQNKHADTKLKALRTCLALWRWVAQQNNRRKYDWPGWTRVGYMIAHCPCCEYVPDNCNKCPLNGYAWRKLPNTDMFCLKDPTSLYVGWHANYDTSAAAKMVRAIQAAIKDLPRRKQPKESR